MFRVAFILLALGSGPTLAGSKYYSASITQVFVDDARFGGCMAKVSPSPKVYLDGCKDNYVTFSCDGTHNSKSAGNTKYSAAQLALVTNTKVNIDVIDGKKISGYCFVRRIDNTQTPNPE